MRKICTALCSFAPLAIFACNPFFPETYFERDPSFSESRRNAGSEPEKTCFWDESAQLLHALAEKTFPEEAHGAKLTRIFSRTDAATVLKDEISAAGTVAGASEQEIAAAHSAYTALAKSLEEDSDSNIPDGDAGFMTEFYLYLRGVAELKKSPERNPKAWNALLALPPEKRRFRTSYVLYMQGNRLVVNAPDAAYEKYRELRRAVKNGFHDPRSLAESSYWTNTRTNDTEAQLKYLLLGMLVDGGAGRPRFSDELYRLKKRITQAKKPLTREILYCFDPMSPFLTADAKYLAADVQAYFALRRGSFEQAKHCLAQVASPTLLSTYVAAKLARFQGNSEMAAYYLQDWLELYRQAKSPRELSDFCREVKGSLGMVRVNQGDFAEALYVFLAVDSPMDAALVAERCLSLDALADFLRVHKGHERMEYLLARRALREGRGAIACEFAPAKLKPLFERYCKLVALGNRPETAPETRALAFFDLGRLQSAMGMELLGYELGPDGFCYGGRFEPGAFRPRFDSEHRLSWEGISGERRFGYRDRAIESFLRSAMLTRNVDVKLAALLFGYKIAMRPGGGSTRLYAPTAFNRLICDLRPAPLAELVFSRRRLIGECALLQTDFPPAQDTEPAALKKLLEFHIPSGIFDLDAMKRRFAGLTPGMSVRDAEEIVGVGAFSSDFPAAEKCLVYPLPDYRRNGHCVKLCFSCGSLERIVNETGGSFPNPLARPLK